jgi:D-glucosaminate-6-phosphate ammonia-lyase
MSRGVDALAGGWEAGTISGDTISGPIHMGEYLNAKFTAKKHSYPTEHTRIVVPKGPPLAT